MKTIPDILAEIPELATEAWQTWGTKAISDDGDRRRTIPGPRTLADLDRLLVLNDSNDYDGLGVLSGWVRAIVDELREAGEPYDWPTNDVPAACTWITQHLRWSIGRGYEDELHGDLRRLHGRLRHICGVREEYVPRCRHCSHAVIPIDGATKERSSWEVASYGFCSGCAATYPKGPALEALGRLQEYTLIEISERTGFNIWTLRDWAKKKLIASTGMQGNARTYNLDTVMRLIESSETRRAG